MAPHKITGLNQLREMQMGDWLHYASIPLPKERFTYLRDAVVMITGGGGTVGSELCRQVAVQSPRALIVLDRDELALRHTCVTGVSTSWGSADSPVLFCHELHEFYEFIFFSSC